MPEMCMRYILTVNILNLSLLFCFPVPSPMNSKNGDNLVDNKTKCDIWSDRAESHAIPYLN